MPERIIIKGENSDEHTSTSAGAALGWGTVHVPHQAQQTGAAAWLQPLLRGTLEMARRW